MFRPRLVVAAGLLAGAAGVVRAEAQSPGPISSLAVRLASIPAVTGYEQSLVDTLLQLLPGARRDRAGNARLQLGGTNRTSRRLAVCPLDEPGYVIGNIREDGYLTLRRVPGVVPPLFDQEIEGHRVTVYGARGPVPGVVAVRSIHLTRGRAPPAERPFTVDDAYVDVGAQSPSEAAGLGIHVLAPTTLAKRPHLYGEGLLAAPMAGRRAACGALLLATLQSITRAKLIPPLVVAFVVRQRLGQGGLATVGNESGPFQETLMVDASPGALGSLVRAAGPDTISPVQALGRVTHFSVPTRYTGTAVETVSLADADSLRAALVRWIGGDQ